ASLRRCTTAKAWRTPTKTQISNFAKIHVFREFRFGLICYK
ncbi:Os07g0613866, partial [Oryza sativa Japonica Group]